MAGSEPNPTLVMDRYWNLVMANESAFAWTVGVDPSLLGPPLNVLRLTLDPAGLAGSIVNFDDVASHLVHRVRRQFAVTGYPRLGDLLAEAESLAGEAVDVHPANSDAVVTVEIDLPDGPRRYVSIVSTFGTALDVTASELMIETFVDVTE